MPRLARDEFQSTVFESGLDAVKRSDRDALVLLDTQNCTLSDTGKLRELGLAYAKR
nr:hypothetical protein [Mesorhizobium sp.]